MTDLLITDSVSKNFGNFRALNNVSIAVPKGSIFGLLGPNGAGKTTLIRIINQITMPDTGGVFLDGEPLRPEHIKNIGYLPEERGLYKSMKVGEQALYLAQLKGLSKQEAKQRLKYWFEKLEIGDWWNKKIQELSKGQAQKIQFIVTVLHRPKLLIFDEPFSGFDPINANLIKDEILQLRDEGATVIFSTHRMESVEELCDHIALIHKSNKVLDGKLTDIKKTYRTNTFEVGLQTDAIDQVTRDIKEKFEVLPATFKNLNDDVKLNIKLNGNYNSNELLSFLTSKAEVHHFVEVIPSANDIFIQTVKNN
ncbi:ABC transporter ATP-binding protein [Psychroserpens sp.]|uniref:ABC transporter ATP-binding protein n=1 Tax=Psychroserpens sp. TaxID=2020870 RepID=UPI001B14FFFB|nr:ABC transporter ATP-binding protein [Psychroserpens sp.]MBO6607145.1 ATP-binding cassette domain-containing protein [Psychroserpens sp.]MBO6632118.1 ATP-binding cassette domain-containing protein [Psychroserpens sp.]MBO6654291.1 ATP-binding cassette domain-containing protein [Psychroserpens sp.]MBO6682423.1 ATP-binding cassette domain-containing protein [Psychroserpens sp.]MBO6750917.1 ATP-binding cassette domain-containing protein [Psychroserpens sp.]